MEATVYYPKTKAAWRKWLEKYHLTRESVWMVCYTKASGKPTVSWSDAVDVALCFGWIDSKKKKVDAATSHQFFSKRKPRSTWSKTNKEKVKLLTEQGLMTAAGLQCIEIAKQNGSWNLLDEVEALELPRDLLSAFRKHKGSKAYFNSLSKSIKKMMLQWIVMARRPETRQHRIEQIASLAAQQKKPAQF